MLRTRACDNIVYSSNCSRQRRQCRHNDSHTQAGVRLRHASQRGVRVYPQCTENAVHGMDFWLSQQERVVDPLNVCLQCPRLHKHPHTNPQLFCQIWKSTLVLVIHSLTYAPLLLGTQQALLRALGPQRCPTRGNAICAML